MVDDRRPERGLDGRHLTQRHRGGRTVGAGHYQRQLPQVLGPAPRLGREPHHHVTGLATRILPVARVDPGKGRPERLCHLAHRDSHRAGQAPVELHVDLRLLTLAGKRHVHRVRHLFHLGHDLLGGRAYRSHVGTGHFQRQLLPAPAPVAGEHRKVRAGEQLDLVTHRGRELLDALAALIHRHHLHVHVADVHRARGLIAQRGVGVTDFRVGPYDRGGLLRLDPGVLEVGARGRFQLEVEFRLVVHREERATHLHELWRDPHQGHRQHHPAQH